MNKIVKKKMLTETIFLMEIEAPRVAKSALPGQFIIIKNTEKGEKSSPLQSLITMLKRVQLLLLLRLSVINYGTYELQRRRLCL